jgi:hypothetical protein
MLALAIIINFILAALLYPEVFVRVDLRMVQGHETCGTMQYVFYLIGQFYQGGIQLFNPYDLFNTSFTQLSIGLYTPVNFLIAGGYILLSPFTDHPAEFFHHWYVVAYYGFGLLLRTFGTYILASYMTKSRLTAFLTTILVNCFCAITLIHMGGLCIASVYNYLPLLMFCLVYYWDTRYLKAIVAAILVFILAVNNSMYVGLGYFYQTLHLFLFDMLVIWLLFQRRKGIPFLKDRFHWKTAAKTMLAAALIFLPVIWWTLSLNSDFEAAGSGIGSTSGRFHRIFNPAAMMHDTSRFFIPFDQVFKTAYDFTFNGWYMSGAFLGVAIMVLVLIGLVLAKHSYKFVFISAAVMMAFLNIPSTKGGWMMWAHWLDTITNPFCFLVRSFHYSVLLWYLTMAVPLCLGIKACIALIKKDTKSIYADRVKILVVILACFMAASFVLPDVRLKMYAVSVLALFIGFLILMSGKWTLPKRNVIAALFVVLIFVIEFFALHTYINTKSVDMNWAYWDGLRVKPRVHAPMYTAQPMVLDYQNPKITPFRFYYRTDAQVVFPLISEFQGMFGDFYRYIPMALRLERPASMYIPRLKVFKDIDQNEHIQEYIRRDARVMYVADAAIAPDKNVYEQILKFNLDRRVVEAEGAYAEKLQKYTDLKLSSPVPPKFRRFEYNFKLSQAAVKKKSAGKEYQWKLPKDFPMYLSTAVFTPDVQLWQVKAGEDVLVPAQGALVSPKTFDVNNVRDGYLTILMPKDAAVTEDVNLLVFTPAEVINVWKFTHDELGLTYQVDKDGWWVMHMPYDPKWELYIDGKKTPIAKINGYFIGAPVTSGEHQIYLTYWPNSPLRFLIILSVLTAWVIMVIVFRKTYQWSKEI